ncbi:MAG: hypothetical protein ACREFR_16125, partial [Limisphaerales bacterium]
MKFSLNPQRPKGIALLATLCAIAVMLVVFAGVMYWVSSNGSQTRRNQIFTSSEAAAEGASEMVFAQMDRDYLYGVLNQTVSAYEAMTPLTTNWPVQYTFKINVNEGAQSQTLQTMDTMYTNLLAYPETNTITATATPIGQFMSVPATVSQTMIFSEVPVFQFAIFYNLDLDMSPGSSMTVNGNTFCNENIWCYPEGQMTFNGSVEAAGSYFFHWDTNGDQSSNIPGARNVTKPNFKDGAPLSHADPLILPIGAGGNSASAITNTSASVEAIIEIPPAGVAAPQQIAYDSTNQVYLFNEASLIVSNAAFGINGAPPWTNPFTVYFQDNWQSPSFTESNSVGWHWVQLTNDFYIISNSYHGSYTMVPTNRVPNFEFTNNTLAMRWTNSVAADGPVGTNYVWYAGFSFLTNVTYYDYRESKTNETVQLDVGKLGAWITNSGPNEGSNWNQDLAIDANNGINSIYIYNDAPVTSKLLPSVSVIDGALLPSSTTTVEGTNDFTCGLTVATVQP